ncbi:MAG: hypothetical protein QM752_00975 [Gammaproteobacteria bacterium]
MTEESTSTILDPLNSEEKKNTSDYKRGSQIAIGWYSVTYESSPVDIIHETPLNFLNSNPAEKSQTVADKIANIKNYYRRIPAVEKVASKESYKNNDYVVTKNWLHTQEPTEEIEDDNAMVSFIAEKIPGTVLAESLEKIKLLSLKQRVNLILQLIDQVCSRHVNKPSTGEANYHGDAHLSNIMFYCPESGEPSVTLFDHDRSSILTDEQLRDPNYLRPYFFQGSNKLYHPPESCPEDSKKEACYGIKSDTFMLVSSILFILGEPDPFASRKACDEGKETVIPFDDQGVVDFPSIDSYNLRNITLQFIRRMQEQQVSRRPDDEELLRFFTNLQLVVKLEAEPGWLELQKKPYRDITKRFGALAFLCLIGTAAGLAINRKFMMTAFDPLKISQPYVLLICFAAILAITAFVMFKRTPSIQILEQMQALAHNTYIKPKLGEFVGESERITTAPAISS